MPRWSIWLILAALAATARSQPVQVAESTFSDGDWVGTKIFDNTADGSATFTARQVAAGGNPGAYREVTQRVGLGTIWVAHIGTGATYDPRTQGAIARIDFSYDLIHLNAPPNQAVGYSPTLFQNGNFYRFSTFDSVFNAAWSPFSRNGLTPDDFFRAAGSGPARPDFSESGGPIQFGYTSLITSTIAAQVTRQSGLDNLSITIHRRVAVQGLSVSGRTLNFEFTQNGPAPPAQNVDLSNSTGILNYSAASDQAWLRVSPAAGATPSVLAISVDAATLAPGDYAGVVTVESRGGAPSIATIAVALRVRGAAPALAVDQRSLSFHLTSPSSRSTGRVTIRNAGGGPLTFSASATSEVGSWLSLSTNAGTATAANPAFLLATASAAGMNPGTYTGTISIRTAAGDFDVTVTMSIAGNPTLLAVTPNGLTFQAIAGGPAPPEQNFAVTVQGAGDFNWTAATSVVSGGSWLSIQTNAGNAADGNPSKVNVRVNPAGLAAGDYYGQIDVTATGLPNSSQSVVVVLTIAAPSLAPSAVVAPGGLIFVAQPGGSNLSKSVTISNTGLQEIQFVATTALQAGGNVFTLPVAGGSVASGESLALEVRPTPAGLAAGVYPAELRIHIAGETSARRIGLLLVLAQGAITFTADRQRREAGNCVPTRLIPAN